MDPVDEEPQGWASVQQDAETDRPVVTLGGEVDADSVDAMRSAVTAALPESLAAVVIDLSAVEFMDSAGITLLLEIAKRAESVVVRNPSRAATLVIDATGLGGFLPTEP